MKAIKLQTVITSIRSKVDKSLGLTLSTPELTPEERVEVMNYQGINSVMFIKPIDSNADDILEINSEIERKTPSQRLKAVIYVWWDQQGRPGTLDSFYKETMEKFINHIKEKLD